MLVEDAIQQLLRLAATEEHQEEVMALLCEAFPNVPHGKDDIFLPGYAVRRILQAPEIMALEEEAQWRLADWASQAVLDYMSSAPVGKPRQAIAATLAEGGLGLKAATVLAEVLGDLRQADATSERIFRLLYFAGKELPVTADWLLRTHGEFGDRCLQRAGDRDLEAIEEAAQELVAEECRAVEEVLESELTAIHSEWTMEKLHRAGIRPPGRTTRILDEVRAKDRRFWDALQESVESLPERFRRGSLLSELFLATEKGPGFTPEDSRRLRFYALAVLKRLQLRRWQDQAEATQNVFPLEAVNEDGEEYERDAEGRSNEWLLGALIDHRLDKVVEKVRQVEEMFLQDCPDLVRTYEVCFPKETSGLTRKQIAQSLGINESTVTRRMKTIQKYFGDKLQEEGINLDHYRSPQLSRQVDQLYDLVEKFFTVSLSMGKTSERRVALMEAIQSLFSHDPDTYELVRERYFDETLPSDMAVQRGLKTEDLQALLNQAQRELAERIQQIDQRKRDILATIRDEFIQESPSLALTFDLLYRAVPALKRRNLAAIYGLGPAAILLLDRQIQKRLESRLEAFGFTLKDFRQRLPDYRLRDLFMSVSQNSESEICECIRELGGEAFLREVFRSGDLSDMNPEVKGLVQRIAERRITKTGRSDSEISGGV